MVADRYALSLASGSSSPVPNQHEDFFILLQISVNLCLSVGMTLIILAGRSICRSAQSWACPGRVAAGPCEDTVLR